MGQAPIPRLQRMERPRESVQYTGQASVDDVSLFVRKYWPRAASGYTPAMQTLEFKGEDGGPECTGASRAGVQAKLENHLVGKRIERRGVHDFKVIFTGRDQPVPDCVGATVQAEVEIRVIPYD